MFLHHLKKCSFDFMIHCKRKTWLSPRTLTCLDMDTLSYGSSRTRILNACSLNRCTYVFVLVLVLCGIRWLWLSGSWLLAKCECVIMLTSVVSAWNRANMDGCCRAELHITPFGGFVCAVLSGRIVAGTHDYH
ncbi:hypothetical protein BS78_05G075400 [Paspalum vaginatum]|nr:hypothetical protein BS78_05G075400 [Paspalum vaginatum]